MANPTYSTNKGNNPNLHIAAQRPNGDYDPEYPEDSDEYIEDSLNIQVCKSLDGSASLQFSVYEWNEDSTNSLSLNGLPYDKAVQFTKMVRNFFERNKKDIKEFLEK